MFAVLIPVLLAPVQTGPSVAAHLEGWNVISACAILSQGEQHARIIDRDVATPVGGGVQEQTGTNVEQVEVAIGRL